MTCEIFLPAAGDCCGVGVVASGVGPVFPVVLWSGGDCWRLGQEPEGTLLGAGWHATNSGHSACPWASLGFWLQLSIQIHQAWEILAGRKQLTWRCARKIVGYEAEWNNARAAQIYLQAANHRFKSQGSRGGKAAALGVRGHYVKMSG